MEKPNLNPQENASENIERPTVKDFNFFASLGNPNGFKESKQFEGTSDMLDKATPFEDTDFLTLFKILHSGDNYLGIHFKHLEQGSARGGAHSGMGFVFEKEKVINHALVKKLLPFVEKFREDNFTKQGDKWIINTNDPCEIKVNDYPKKED